MLLATPAATSRAVLDRWLPASSVSPPAGVAAVLRSRSSTMPSRMRPELRMRLRSAARPASPASSTSSSSISL